MAEIAQDSGGKHKGKKSKTKKMSTRVDLTPMVDLAFLLITFFMLTTTLIKPQTMEISMPSKDKLKEEEQQKIKASQAMTIIAAGKDSLFYYFGTKDVEKNLDPEIKLSDYTPDGLRKILLVRNAQVIANIEEFKSKPEIKKMNEDTLKKKISVIKGDKKAPVIVIKALDNATYNNLVDILDEMQICNIGKYAIVDINKYDKELIANFRKNKK